MPISVKICQKYAITSINNIIQNSMYSASKNIKSEDFILRSDNNGRLEYLSVNSIIVNNICAETASTVSQNLNNLTTSKIRLPLGVFTGLPILSHFGPSTTIRLQPIGDATADYETSMTQAGVNQVKFSSLDKCTYNSFHSKSPLVKGFGDNQKTNPCKHSI